MGSLAHSILENPENRRAAVREGDSDMMFQGGII